MACIGLESVDAIVDGNYDSIESLPDWMREKLADQWLGFEKNELAGWLAAAGFDLKSYTVAEGEGEELAVFIAVARKPA